MVASLHPRPASWLPYVYTSLPEKGCRRSVELEKGYVWIFRGGAELTDFQTQQLIAVVHLDKGQSMREIEPQMGLPCKSGRKM